MTSNLGLVDTNVLVYAVYPAVPQHASSRALLDQARQPGAGLCVVPQNLAEFYATVTNPRRVTQVKSTTEALDAIDDLLALPGLTLLAVPPDIVTRLTQLLRQHPVQAQETYDAQLVATMLGNGAGPPHQNRQTGTNGEFDIRRESGFLWHMFAAFHEFFYHFSHRA